MKLKFLFYSAILFFVLGRHYHDELIFYFFSVQMLILYVAVFFYKREMKIIARSADDTESADETEPAGEAENTGETESAAEPSAS